MNLPRALRPMAQKITNLMARGTVLAADAKGKLQTLQMGLLADEKKTAVEHFEPYGFTSNPRPGAETLVTFLEGDRSHGIVIAATDRRYRIRELPSGGVAIYTGPGNSIILDPADTITLETGTLTIKAKAIHIEADTITSQGAWTHTGGMVVDHVDVPHHRHPETGSITEEPIPSA